ncbi:MAG: hypothetical protein QG608_3213 [Actinomycetota bacterium]|nr:hypothetical protein [Actinomycetota bacterium]
MTVYRTAVLLAIFLLPVAVLTTVWVRLWRERHRIPSSFFLATAGLGLFLSLLALISLLWPGQQGGGTPQTWCGIVLGLAGLGSCCACLLLGTITLPLLAVSRGRQAMAGHRDGTPVAPQLPEASDGFDDLPADRPASFEQPTPFEQPVSFEQPTPFEQPVSFEQPAVVSARSTVPADLFRPADLLPPEDMFPPEDMYPPEATPSVQSLPEGWLTSRPPGAGRR